MVEPIIVSDADFENSVLESDVPVLVDFWAEWCGPCKMIAPAVRELASDYEGRAKVAKLDVDDNPNTAMAYGVFSIPTLILFKGGEEVGRTVGATSKGKLAGMIDNHA